MAEGALHRVPCERVGSLRKMCERGASVRLCVCAGAQVCVTFLASAFTPPHVRSPIPHTHALTHTPAAHTQVSAGCLRIHTATPLLGPLGGLAAVAAASVAAGHVSRATLAALQVQRVYRSCVVDWASEYR